MSIIDMAIYILLFIIFYFIIGKSGSENRRTLGEEIK